MMIRKVGPRSLANVVGSIYVVIGLIAGAIVTTMSLLEPSLAQVDKAVLAICWMPLVFGVKGYVVGAVAGWVFNQVATVMGGIEIEVETDAAEARAI